MKKNHRLQDYTQRNLPESAKARLGKGWINEIAYSADGSLLAIASSIGIWIYDADTGQELNLLTGHTSPVYSVAFSRDGRYLVSGSMDSTVRLWDAETGKHIKTLIGHTHGVYSVAFSTDDYHLASGGGDYTARLWNAETGKHIKTFTERSRKPGNQEPSRYVNSVSFSENGLFFASSDARRACLWNIETGKYIKTLTEYSYSNNTISFSESSCFVVNGSNDGTVRVWDVETGTLPENIHKT